MLDSTPNLTRRHALQMVVAIGCCGQSAHAASAQSVDQITDLSATAATNMFRFEPDLVRVAAGEEIAFLNSRGDHTVHSVPQFWPKELEPIKISYKREAVVHFLSDGFYGFRCRRHGQYGMVMLVVAGKGGALDAVPGQIE
ncbi:MAG: plastocyanin/azurin family copper-binding protein, partial [Pseudomonadota bacterium]